MATNFPTGLDDFANYVDGTTIMEAGILNDMQWAIEALQAKVGIDSSAVVTSHDYLLAHIGSLFGAWASKSQDTVYQAATDGLVVCYTYGNNSALKGYTDSNNPPTTQRIGDSSYISVAGANGIMPVRKGDYWKVTNSVGTATIYWIPLGL